MTTCYRPLENSVLNVSDSDIPCDGASPTGCCVYGDICMSNGICQYTKPTTVESGYYLQSCTDSTFQSVIGQETFHCTTLDYPDIVYNATIGLWACCSSDAATGVQCSTATNENWAAPAPDALISIVSLQQAPATFTTSPSLFTTSPTFSTTSSILSLSTPSIASSSSTPIVSSASQPSLIPVSSTAPTSTTTSTSSKSSSDTAAAATTTSSPLPTISAHRTRISAATAAGIGTGVALGLIALLTLTFFAAKILRARKASSRQSNAALFGGPDPTATTQATYTKEDKAELGAGAGYDIGHGYNPAHRFTGEPRFPQYPPELPSSNGLMRYETAGHQQYEIGGRGNGVR